MVEVTEMTKLFRNYRRLCQCEGFHLIAIEKGRNHCRLVFEAGFVTAAVSPSDQRNMMNVRAEIRRLHR